MAFCSTHNELRLVAFLTQVSVGGCRLCAAVVCAEASVINITDNKSFSTFGASVGVMSTFFLNIFVERQLPSNNLVFLHKKIL